MRTVNRAVGAAVATVAMVAASGTAAFAHECYSTGRSAQGHQGAGHSPMWHSEDSASHASYDFVFNVVFGIDPTTAMLDQAVQMHLDRGLQRWVSYFQGHTLMQRQSDGTDTPAASKHAGDGRGIDHWTDSELGQGMIAIAAEILEAQS